jgi:hypothetical protein
MPSYRVAGLNKLYSSSHLTIDLAKAKKSEAELRTTQKKYEQLLHETFYFSPYDI